MVEHRSQLARTCALAQILHDCPSAAATELFVSYPTAAAIADASTDVRANASWWALFGSEAALPPAIADAIAPLSRGETAIDVADVPLGGGRVQHVALRAVPLRTDGVSTGVIVACCDITDDAVRGELGVTREALVWGGVLPGAAEYFSAPWRASRLVPPTHWLDAFHPEDATRCTAAFAEARRMRVSSALELRIRGLDGNYRWYRVQFISRPDGTWYGTASDVHEAILAEERGELLAATRAARADAELANRLKDEFLAMVSHELRGPIATLLLWEKVLRDAATDGSARGQALDAIHQSAIAQSRLVGDLLDVSRAITGKLYIDVRRVDLHQLVREALDAVRPAASAKAIDLRSFWLGTPAEIEGDAARLVQVLENVLSNSIKFTGRGGTVSISVQQPRTDAIEVVISDNGAGIAPELLPHIFEPFTQNDDILTRREGGLGLGLAIAHTIVTLHGGTLTASSAGRGRGTTVNISLPAAITPRAAKAASVPPRAATVVGLHVLIVDDDARVCKAIALLLGRAGAIVTTASSAPEARAALASARTDVIICDIAMPEEDGYAFVRSLRETDTVTPVIALTAFATDTYAGRALDSGFNRHLAKPIHIERLIECINELHGARLASQIT